MGGSGHFQGHLCSNYGAFGVYKHQNHPKRTVYFRHLTLRRCYTVCFFTPPEVTNTGPGFNRGSGGGARGCGFEERVGVHARTGGIHFL